MKAAVLWDKQHLTIENDVELRDPGATEVTVRMVATGVCHTDLTVFNGAFPVPLPVVLGHEGAGVIESVGAEVHDLAPGDHVVLAVTVGCGHCFQCRAGSPGLCESNLPKVLAGTLLDDTARLAHQGTGLHHMFCQSSFAEFAVVPVRAAVKVRKDAPLDVIGLLACGAMTGIGAVMNRARVRPGESVVILGVGGVGLGALLGAKVSGAYPIIAADRSDDALRFAAELGATHTVNSATTDLVETVHSLTGRGADHAFDIVGAAGTIEACLESVRAGGQVVAVGNAEATNTATVPIMSLLFERRLTGSYIGSADPHRDIPRLVDLFMDGRLPLDRLVTRRYDLDHLSQAFEDLEAGHVGRGVIVHG